MRYPFLTPMRLLVLAGVLAAAATATPRPTFVDVKTLAPAIRIDMRYTQPENFLKKAVYPACARCVLREETAAAVARVQASLEKEGLSLVMWDCYRPPAVQKAMWKIVPDARFVADPKKGSMHNRGGAVDVTLAGADGKPLEMPTAHDDFSGKAAPDAPASEVATKNRATLRVAMETEGFTINPHEWWHFNYPGSPSWPIVDQPLCAGK